MIEDSEGKDNYQSLLERATNAIVKARQKEIDKL
jgi:hypothetical protein